MREQAYTIGMQTRAQLNNERTLVVNSLDSREQAGPVLGAQPPTLGAAPMQYTTSIEEVIEGPKIVLIEYYVEGEPSANISVENIETQSARRYNMDANTLVFIASDGAKPVAT